MDAKEFESKSLEITPAGNPFKNTERLRERRLTVVQHIYLSGIDEDPTPHSSSSERKIKSSEQVYGPRKQVAGSEFKPPDIGWFKDDGNPVSMVIIENMEGQHPQTIPTPMERIQIEKRVLAVSLGDDDNCLLISAGQTQSFSVQDPSKLKIKSLADRIQFKVTVFPG